MMRYFLICFCILFFCSVSQAKEVVTNEGRILEISWKHKGNKLKVWGKVKKGKSCRDLRIDISFVNKRTGDRAYIKDSVGKYYASRGGKFSGTDKIYNKLNSTEKRYWRVYSFEDYCN